MIDGMNVAVRSRPASAAAAGLIGDHRSIIALRRAISAAAMGVGPVLVEGPTGAGKEVVANALHAASTCRGQFIAVNVATLPDQLQDSELFGAERGAFTGASPRPGLIEQANGGTLFLDEATELSRITQAKLLRALELGHVRRIGATSERRVQFRLVLATQQPADALLESGRWRDDFYYRVAGVTLVVPSLAERPGDIVVLASHFLAKVGRPPLPAEAGLLLKSHTWPGNVRELQRVLERACFLAGDNQLTLEDCERALETVRRHRSAQTVELHRTLLEVERDHIREVLGAANDARAAAIILGLSVGQLYRRLAGLGIPTPRHRA